MTAAEATAGTTASERASSRSSTRAVLALGTGVAIEITRDALELAMVRVRPGGPELLRRGTIARLHERSAVEWSAEYRDFIRRQTPAGVTVLLPRRDVIVRHLQLPGVSRREMPGALALRLRSLHPFSDEDVAWCWSPVRSGALIGLTRLSVLARYESLFAEAGIPVAGFTFSASALHAALRLYGEPALPLLALSETSTNVFEAYGENASGAVFSGEFTGSAERASAAGVADLRLPSDFQPAGLAKALPLKSTLDPNPIDRPLLFAAAVAAAVPLLLRPANFLPPERRAGRSRVWLIPTAILALLLVGAVFALLAMGPYRQRRYGETLQQEIEKTEPAAHRAAALDRAIGHAESNIELLDRFRAQSKGDIDVLNELTRILPPPAWASSVEIHPEYVVIAGQAPQAAPLLGILDSSPLFHDSAFATSVSRNGKDETFRIRTLRKAP